MKIPPPTHTHTPTHSLLTPFRKHRNTVRKYLQGKEEREHTCSERDLKEGERKMKYEPINAELLLRLWGVCSHDLCSEG